MGAGWVTAVHGNTAQEGDRGSGAASSGGGEGDDGASSGGRLSTEASPSTGSSKLASLTEGRSIREDATAAPAAAAVAETVAATPAVPTTSESMSLAAAVAAAAVPHVASQTQGLDPQLATASSSSSSSSLSPLSPPPPAGDVPPATATTAPAMLSLQYVIPSAHKALSQLPHRTGVAPLEQQKEKQQEQEQQSGEMRQWMARRAPQITIVTTHGEKLPLPPLGWGRRRRQRPPPPPAPKPTRWCTATADETAPEYHMVVLASPRAQQGRYLATTLVSIAAADARPTSLTLLWAVHQRSRGNQTSSGGDGGGGSRRRPVSSDGGGGSVSFSDWQELKAAAATAADLSGVGTEMGDDVDSRHDGGGGGDGDGDYSGGGAVRYSTSNDGGDGGDSDGDGNDDGGDDDGGRGYDVNGVDITLVQRLEMPESGTPGRPGGAAGAVGGADAFSLLSNLEMYVDGGAAALRGGGAAPGGANGQEDREGDSVRPNRNMPRFAFPHLRIRYLPDNVRQGDIMGSYYQALRVPDQVAEEAGDPGMRELPLLILEGDVVLAPRFSDRIRCVLQMMKDLSKPREDLVKGGSDNSSGGGGGGSAATVTPDFAISLYDPSMVPYDVPTVLRIYKDTPLPSDGVEVMDGTNANANTNANTDVGAAVAAEIGGGGGGGGGSGGSGGGGGGSGGSGGSGGGVGAGDVGSFTRLTLLPVWWSWGSQALLYSYGIRMSLMWHYREISSGCAPQDGLQDIELVRHMELRRCVGLPPMPPVKAKPRVKGPACDPRVIHGNDTIARSANASASAAGSFCYLFAVRPNMVQHVGASSTMFGEVSQRFHMSTTFPRRVAVPGLDPPGAW
ncbi:hypothetical protein VaNZ11_006060 [Volvox africanus]|uniref:Uncharacterized protein n=1 Tax=Volvox africanus TaxID=51714 RepID=A0ABQ5RZZ8_9CHLO|nr:hypothetical protein VaNZ11_006060 [Volvox africanus]